MEKIKISNHAFVYPMPMVIVGTEVEGRPNYMAAAWVSRVNFNPPMIGVALGKIHHTNKGIHEHREFSVSVPGSKLMAALIMQVLFPVQRRTSQDCLSHSTESSSMRQWYETAHSPWSAEWFRW